MSQIDPIDTSNEENKMLEKDVTFNDVINVWKHEVAKIEYQLEVVQEEAIRSRLIKIKNTFDDMINTYDKIEYTGICQP